MNSASLPGNLVLMDMGELQSLKGGAKLMAYIDAGCTLYGAYALIIAITPGANLIGGGSVGAFCAGYKLATWLIG
jgi:hypothetical protein